MQSQGSHNFSLGGWLGSGLEPFNLSRVNLWRGRARPIERYLGNCVHLLACVFLALLGPIGRGNINQHWKCCKRAWFAGNGGVPKH